MSDDMLSRLAHAIAVCPVCDQTVTLTPGRLDRPFGTTYSMEPLFNHLDTEHPGWESDDE